MEVLSNVIAVIPHTELTRRAGEAKWDRIIQLRITVLNPLQRKAINLEFLLNKRR